jgi:hypothetical protein
MLVCFWKPSCVNIIVLIGVDYRLSASDKPLVAALNGYGIPIARAAAQCIKFNSSMLLFTVLKYFLTLYEFQLFTFVVFAPLFLEIFYQLTKIFSFIETLLIL